jgi:zinc-binding alcohol dehydrogenase/oxidoreductase
MKAFVLRADSFKVEEIAVPEIGKNEVLVRLKYAALNHRDEWIRAGQYAKIVYPTVLGSDGMGEVVELGAEVAKHWLGKVVIINPNLNWGNHPKYQDMQDYQILGMPAQGTLAEFIVVNADRLHELPKGFTEAEAAALPLAGLTAYNALFNKGQATSDMNILISGVGGGVAQFAFQFALAIGAKVWVTSSKEEVLEKCMLMGAAGRVNYHRPDAYKKVKEESGGFDIIIDSACGEGMNDLLNALNPAGKFVFYGATTGIPSNLNLRNVFWKQLSILGSTMGSDTDFKNMVAFVEQHKVRPLIDKVFDFKDTVHAFDRMKAGFQFGKIVVKVGNA